MTNKKWVVIADGAKAKIYEYQGSEKAFKQIEGGVLSHINEPSRNLVENERGRVFHSADDSRSAMAEPTDPHEYEKEVFARRLSDYLKERGKEYSELIIAAAPNFLGELRKELSDNVKEKVSAELDKDLTNLPEQELEKHFTDALNINPNPREMSQHFTKKRQQA